MRYGEKEIKEFDINKDENFWSNGSRNRYKIDITLPEFMCRCPRSGYPDFATIRLSYVPDEKVIELKALKLYINSFMDRYISHEDATNEIFDVLSSRLKPHWIRVVAEFNPRGNVHTTIEIDSEKVEKGF
jgi:7-cyano-7-deazaguanine reductase